MEPLKEKEGGNLPEKGKDGLLYALGRK